ncbi:hypothetical protein GJ904_17820 [Salmonella enterica]|nr:hypothetical protein [Salmonella enterica subsp. enterica serovar Saintpaul]EEC1302931.1 hypothetical protein [Salmonella enterica]
MSVFFNGQLLVTPTTASAVNDDAMLNQNLSVGNAVAYVGEADGGKPLEVLSFGTPDEARNVLVSGELCDAVVAAFSPSEETGSPLTVRAVRVNPVQQARIELKSPALASGAPFTAGPFAILKGKRYSTEDIMTKVKVEDSKTAVGLQHITVSGRTKGVAWEVKAEDYNRPRVSIEVLTDEVSFNIGYSSITKEIGSATLNLHRSATNAAGNPIAVSQTIDLTKYPNIGEVADYLESAVDANGAKGFKVTFENEDDRLLPISAFDSHLYRDVGVYPMPWNRYCFEQFITNNLNDVLELEWVLGTDGEVYEHAHAGMAATDFAYLTRPQQPVTGDHEWQNALALLEAEDVQWVQVVTGNEKYHALALAHVTVCSNVLRRERRSICGTEAGVDDQTAINRAKHLNSKRVSLVHIGHYAYDANGKLKLRPPYMTAALVAAAFAGVNPGTPLTNKSLHVLGLERKLRNPSDTDKLLKGGVMPIEDTETGYKVTQSITTWLGDSKYNNREQSCGVAIDFAIRNVRQAVDPLRGQKQSPILLSRAISITKGALAELARPEPQGPAVLVGDENSPAYRNVTASVEGDVLRIQFEASPAIPNNYILVTMYAVPYSGSATA